MGSGMPGRLEAVLAALAVALSPAGCVSRTRHGIVPPRPPPAEQTPPPEIEAPARPQPVRIEITRSGHRIEVTGTGLGTVGGPGGGGELRFVITPDEIAAVLAEVDRAGFEQLPVQFGLRYIGYPIDWVTPPDPKDPPTFTRTPPLYVLTVEREGRGKTVTQSAEGERSDAFIALGTSVWAALERAARARPVRTERFGEDLAWLRDGRLPCDTFSLSAGVALAHDGMQGQDWTLVVSGRRVEVHGPEPRRRISGELTDDEWTALLDALGAAPLPYEVHIPARGGRWLGAAAIHRLRFFPNKRIDPTRVPAGAPELFDGVFAVVERIRARIVGR